MRSGYGRGYYGVGQLVQEAPRRKSWFTVVAVIGVGAAVVWLMWPRKRVPLDFGPVGKEPARSPPIITVGADSSLTPSVQITPGAALAPYAPLAPLAPYAPLAPLALVAPAPATSATGAFRKQLEDDARARGFVLVKDYEDSVVKSAKQLQAAGAKVVLAPHLEHLAPRLEP